MAAIAIISSSIRTGRKSHRVALYFKQYLKENQLAIPEILDLEQYQFPIFKERLRLQVNPSKEVLSFAEKITQADGIIIITPEYNGGYPAALKNIIDLLYNEWKRKPIAIATVSDGIFGGTQVITSLQFSLWKIGAWTVPSTFPVPTIEKIFDENGNAFDKENTDKRASVFIKELIWCIEAGAKMKEM